MSPAAMASSRWKNYSVCWGRLPTKVSCLLRGRLVEIPHCIVHCRRQPTLLGGTMSSFISRLRWRTRVIPALTVAILLTLVAFPALVAYAATVHLSTDPFTQVTCAASATTNHHTEVEPDTYSNGSTIVATFQVGRVSDGGSCDIGFATSTNNGGSWGTPGLLPGTTVFATPAGPYDRISDPSVAFDARHNTWLI